jgi:hypothetical protein
LGQILGVAPIPNKTLLLLDRALPACSERSLALFDQGNASLYLAVTVLSSKLRIN